MNLKAVHANYPQLLLLESAIYIGSRDFNARKFLLEVHTNSCYKDLELGQRRLIAAVEKRTEIMKNLVRDNFDQFVTAKSTVDAIYRELKSKNLNSAGYGTDTFSQTLTSSLAPPASC